MFGELVIAGADAGLRASQVGRPHALMEGAAVGTGDITPADQIPVQRVALDPICREEHGGSVALFQGLPDTLLGSGHDRLFLSASDPGPGRGSRRWT